ncbi:stage III sporulation protein AG [Heyndrickxia coagulans]|uniref:stage III sporulation protein AG n=1 Tax=Heyndrickxia coagulans TaxID=1398 RepID=UPI0021F23245|nr:stage III sporulation protein AG [Heyndrickxia coagulans]UYM82556.1 stage III sporulation protein AG [Heyndrickxia coagulans]
MDRNQGPFKKLKEKWLPSGPPDKKKKLVLLTVLLISGLGMMFINDLFGHSSEKNEALTASSPVKTAGGKGTAAFGAGTSKKSKSISTYENQYEKELKSILEQIKGVGSVNVRVNVAASESKVYEKNATIRNETTAETDKNGGERKIDSISKDDKVVIVQNGDKEVPLVTETRKPEITGVLVVCSGGGDVSIQKSVKEAVASALDIASYRVSVMPKKE